MVESTEDVSIFESNIGPSCASVLKQVDSRRGELTNLSHAAILNEEINQVYMLHVNCACVHVHIHVCCMYNVYMLQHMYMYSTSEKPSTL